MSIILFAIFGVLGLFLLWMSYKTRQILICLLTAFTWFALEFWAFFSSAAYFNLEDQYVKILAWVMLGLAFLPLIWSMNQEIRHEAKGQSWVTYGSPPEERGPSSTEIYRERIKRRLRR